MGRPRGRQAQDRANLRRRHGPRADRVAVRALVIRGRALPHPASDRLPDADQGICLRKWRSPNPLKKVGGSWCRRAGLNCRPQPYQGCALPLSYGGERRGGGYSQTSSPREVQKVLSVTLDARGAARHAGAMSGRPTTPSDPKAAREAQLAQALRANLRRRKAAPEGRPLRRGEADDPLEPDFSQSAAQGK